MAQDVAAFLTWTAEPTLVKRKQTGWPVLGFLIFATILAWLAKKQIWAPVKPAKRKDKADRVLENAGIISGDTRAET
jgi:ubiquinol-cytochrome c reductase cytochrome c1 subunit